MGKSGRPLLYHKEKRKRGPMVTRKMLEIEGITIMPPERFCRVHKPHTDVNAIARFISVKRKPDKDTINAMKSELESIENSLKKLYLLLAQRRDVLTIVAGISLLYEKPLEQMRTFRETYAILADIAERMENGEYLDISPRKKINSDRFKMKISWFYEIPMLCELYFKALDSRRGEYANYEIPYITRKEFDGLRRS